MSDCRLTLTDGIVEGSGTNRVRQFLRLPYAAPLTNERRFRMPQPVEPWSSVRDASIADPCAPQHYGEIPGNDMAAPMGESCPLGTDYLTLNTWTPSDAGDCPVMLFIHGGSLVAGGKDARVFDGSAFARYGAVCITIHYRLEIEGVLPIPGVPTNLGLRDAIAALEWVQRNISMFGRDPGNVTIFGESAGATAVAMLTLSPLAKGLFRRAICESGHAKWARKAAVMHPIVKRLARRLGVSPDRDGFVSVSSEKLLKAQEWIAKPSSFLNMRDEDGRDLMFGAGRFMPVPSEDVLPQRLIETLRCGAGSHVYRLIESTSEEANLFLVPAGSGDKMRRWRLQLLSRRAVRNSGALLRTYGIDARGASRGKLFGRPITNLFFRAINRRTAELHRGRT